MRLAQGLAPPRTVMYRWRPIPKCMGMSLHLGLSDCVGAVACGRGPYAADWYVTVFHVCIVFYQQCVTVGKLD